MKVIHMPVITLQSPLSRAFLFRLACYFLDAGVVEAGINTWLIGRTTYMKTRG